MNAKDQSKLARAGYTIIRRQNEPEPHFKIKDSAGPDSWRKFIYKKRRCFKSIFIKTKFFLQSSFYYQNCWIIQSKKFEKHLTDALNSTFRINFFINN